MKSFKLKNLVLVLSLFFGMPVYAQQIPTGTPIKIDMILAISQNIGGFLFTLGSILAVITIIVSGIMYFLVGANPQKVGTAKGILKAGIIGTLIIFSAGVIIATIQNFATDPFGFFGGGGGISPYCDVNGECVGGPNGGNFCQYDSDC
ncbi:MAG: hypothetical protein A2817_03215 [Candidatus Yanofskybacteria bacterium RIFCSPHIGHO2_01_FULL_39_8b]|uniref:Uncharacterized protein n=1 Tax=Candidatus Yanofskybacteria bacterium RIFCSPHIGHO2_01_FULL_39_8b TaxID=1802659 RepID=A0A1F8ECN1_9BACT|nr:MAG: hypothetical protein A2817_03215 [Candidatus Yanofskybacteria bacterium RIFCSPHIGHO2_01_FULL_39_8b]